MLLLALYGISLAFVALLRDMLAGMVRASRRAR
jgi:hypothetical protein